MKQHFQDLYLLEFIGRKQVILHLVNLVAATQPKAMYWEPEVLSKLLCLTGIFHLDFNLQFEDLMPCSSTMSETPSDDPTMITCACCAC